MAIKSIAGAVGGGGGGGGPTYQIYGLQELNDLVNGIPTEFNRIFQTTAQKYSKSMYSTMSQKVPVKTGFLKRSIGAEANVQQMAVFVNAKYARFVDQGTFRMTARPFFTSTKDEQIPKMIAELNSQVAAYIKSKVS